MNCPRVSARLLRRQAGRAEPVIQFGELALDPATREVTFEGRALALSAREFALLEALLDRPGAVLSREQLEEKLYGWDEEVESNTVEVYIHSLRKKLGQDFIKNIRGVGYMVPKTIMTSIRRRLLVWLLLGLSATTLVAAFAVYARARLEAGELFDYQLQVMAAAFPHEGFGPATAPRLDEADAGDVVVVQIWDQNGAQLYLSRPGSPLLQRVDLGFSTVATPRGDWRVFNTLVGDNIVQVSQPMRAREELAAGLALRTMLPLLILLPVLVGLIWITVGRGLRPLDAIAVGAQPAVARMRLSRCRAIACRTKCRPLVAALNDLLVRLGGALDVQRSFIADAAHELRTPLTAVRLQIQLAERAATGIERAAAFAQLKGGAERAARLVQQLLTLARNEPGAAGRALAAVDITRYRAPGGGRARGRGGSEGARARIDGRHRRVRRGRRRCLAHAAGQSRRQRDQIHAVRRSRRRGGDG